MCEEKARLRRLRRRFENLLAMRHTLEQQRLEIEALAVMSGNVALAELAERQAETLDSLKKEGAAIWRELDEAIALKGGEEERGREEIYELSKDEA